MKLSNSELKKILGGGREDFKGENIYAKCPRCGFQEWGISTKEGHKFGCFRKSKCGWTGNIWTLLIEFNLLHEYLGGKTVVSGEKLLDRVNLQLESKKESFILPSTTQPLKYIRLTGKETNNKVVEYLKSRNWDFSQNEVGYSLIDFEVGYSNYAIFPVKMTSPAFSEETDWNGWVGRSIKSKSEIEKHNALNSYQKILRYKNSIGTDFGKLFYGWRENLVETAEMVILTEGIFDKVNVDRILKLNKNEKVVCLATFKCGVSEEQLLLLKGIKNLKKIIIFYDNDVVEKIKRLCVSLEKICGGVMIGFNDKDDRDAGDADEELISEIFENLKTPYQFFMDKVQKKILK